MAARNNPKREKQIESARKIAKATGEAHLDPEILFGRASNDDLELYTPEMLALSAVHSAKELAAWSGKAPRVSIDTIAILGIVNDIVDCSHTGSSERNSAPSSTVGLTFGLFNF